MPAARPVGRFAVEFLAMCVVMCAGGIALAALFFGGLALAGFSGFEAAFPEVSIVIMSVFYALPMAAYMRVRGHGARHNVQMSGLAVVVGVLFAFGYWTGAIAAGSVVNWGSLQLLMCGPECLAMLLLMLTQRHMYTGSMQHGAYGPMN